MRESEVFRLPSRIDISARTAFQSGTGAALRVLLEDSGHDSTKSRTPLIPRVRFAMISSYLTRQFVVGRHRREILRTLLELQQETVQRLYSGYLNQGFPLPPTSDYPGPKAKEGLLYLLVRTLRPDFVVETGVDQGVSSYFILEALCKNGHGRLLSIDIGGKTRSGNPVGWLVPGDMRDRWTLILQPSQVALPQIEEEPDLFLHDSLHTFHHMMLEFEWAARRLRQGGILVSDDIGDNEAFRLFIASRHGKFTPISERVVGVAMKEG